MLKYGLYPEIINFPIIFNQNPDENALEFLAFGRGLSWIASEMLEILTKIFRRIFKQGQRDGSTDPLSFYHLFVE